MSKDIKYDAGKAPVSRGFLEYFPRAARAVAVVSGAGYEKYQQWGGWGNDLADPADAIARYKDAMARHVLNVAAGKVYDMVDDMGQPGTRCLELAMVAWNALAVLELVLRTTPDFPLRKPAPAAPEPVNSIERLKKLAARIDAKVPFPCPDPGQEPVEFDQCPVGSLAAEGCVHCGAEPYGPCKHVSAPFDMMGKPRKMMGKPRKDYEPMRRGDALD